MSVQVENLEKNMVKLTIEVAEDKVAEALKAAYNKQKNKISILDSVKEKFQWLW